MESWSYNVSERREEGDMGGMGEALEAVYPFFLY